MSRGADRWQPTLGAWREGAGVRFRVWAPERTQVDLLLNPGQSDARRMPLSRETGGTFSGTADASAGTRYAYLLDGDGPFPDPASRSQPDGVHEPSAVVDPERFDWHDRGWRGVPMHEVVVYETHVGTFTPEGTFDGVAGKLGYLRDLGVTAVELMPVADFPGSRNWGYDGVCPFAPARCYGAPDDLRRLVDAAHQLGVAVLLDVVYNHFGPDGAYFSQFSPHYFSTRHTTPWGQAINLDGDRSEHVRGFFIENVMHWIHEYHIDGLRLDATHALIDDSPRHFLRELSERVRAAVDDRHVLLIAEDDRNLATMITPVADGGWGLDAAWADDFHHHARSLSAGDTDGYFQDFSGSTRDLADTIRRGWFFIGQHSAYRGEPRGTDPAGVPPERMVICLQNHDQIGNRAFGERVNHQIDPAVFRALTAVLLFAPETPLLFMGQEWAASSPFLYFTDHTPELGKLVTEGRRQEFSRFAAFRDEATRARIPDPQAEQTFRASRLDWSEREREPHAGVERLYRDLLALRRREPALKGAAGSRCDVAALDDDTLAVLRRGASGDAWLLVARLNGAGAVPLESWDVLDPRWTWARSLTTEDAGVVAAPMPVRTLLDAPLTLHFERPSAIILRRQ